ncbi:MBL fold metallo-hydrolase [Rhizomonospora bruguierae]|uniref:MBL fold metallo-hydrolase n=1 Tax=Rhizomonospora bruguierae TaxID=1581705 RepID=UPI001BCB8BA8
MSITVQVVGTSTPYPRPNNPCSGYLLETAATRVLADIGLGVWPHLLRYTNPARLDAIWVSHLHPDHSGDLLAAYQWAANTVGAPRLTVIGPSGWAERIGAALPTPNGPAQLRQLFDVREHTEEITPIGDLELASLPVQHSVPTHGLRVTHDMRTFAYSGDSGPGSALARLAENADMFICEAGSTTSNEPYHCSPEDAAHMAQTAKELAITHLGTGLTPTEALRRAGRGVAARPGLVLRVP